MYNAVAVRPHPARIRAMIVPREHGAWGLLLVPLFTGIVVAIPAGAAFAPLMLFITAALALFWLRTPVESLLGSGPMRAQTPAERHAALLASLLLTIISAACVAALMWNRPDRELPLLGGIVAFALLAQMLLKRSGRHLRMAAQMAGAIGLTCTAPAAYYVATGRLNQTALVLWAANWLFAADQIHYVQLRIHGARAITFRQKLGRGWIFLLGQIVMLAALIAASFLRLVPALVILAFAPVLMRGTWWFFREYQPLKVKHLGWSEMLQGMVFGILLATSFFTAN